MLSSFTVSNFLSFNDAQCISLNAGKVRSNSDRIYAQGNTKLLKFLAIYGANSSGKSNIIRAFEFAQRMIVYGIPTASRSKYCRIYDTNRDKESLFEFVICIGKKEYCYGFKVLLNTGNIISEWLKELQKTAAAKTIFERNVVLGTYSVDCFFKSSAANNRLKIYAEDIRVDGSVLFLQLMNSNKDSLYKSFPLIHIYNDVYNSIRYNLSINSPDRPVTNYPYLTDRDSLDQIGDLLHAFGTGISHLNIVEIPKEKVVSRLPDGLFDHIQETLKEQQKRYETESAEHIPAIMLRSDDNAMYIIEYVNGECVFKTVEFEHDKTSSAFSLPEESDGTVRLLDLIEILISKDEDKVYVIDEINRRFHPLLTYKFVDDYLKLAKSRNIQLIVTTHESKLMDFDLLRKDEIAFINRNEDGTSEFYSMEAFGERFDKKIRKAYFDGQYGAIPQFDSNME